MRRTAGVDFDASVSMCEEGTLAYNRGASIAKRERERARQLRVQRATEKLERPASESDVDPDIAGIVPGPQPPQPEGE
jgi:hypothetical protein